MNQTQHDALSELRHDLRNPIGQILGFAEILIEDARDEQRIEADDLEKIRGAANKLLTLIDNRLTDNLLNPAAVRPIAPESAQGRILIVDDIPENRDVLARRLERQGYETTQAENGAMALALLAAEPFDLVLLDIMMPGMDGYEVLQKIKSDAAISYIPVIMVSAVDEIESAVRCIEIGAADYLNKPFNAVLLRARVGACIREKQARDREMRLARELQETLNRVLAAEKLRDDLTNMIVHDLRTPLTSVFSGLQTIESLGELDEMQSEMLALSIDGSQTLLGMINDLLDVSKMESGTMTLDYSEIAPGDVAKKAQNQIALLARTKGLNLAEQIADDLPLIAADEEKLRRTMVNLLGNALKFTPKAGTITVGARMFGPSEILFCVSDTGEGIPQEAFGKIFEKFGQVESRKAGRKMSTGLGLTFCKMAVEAHGGRIWVESELGAGSAFYFTIPVQRPEN